MSGGVITSSNCCCADCQYQTCARGETCCRDGSCAGCIDNKCCDEKRNTGASCCKGTNKLGGVSGDSAVCIVSGEKLVEGKEVVYSYMGKDYKFCCGDCAEGFKTEPIKFIKEGLTCPIMNEPVKKNVYTVYEGTKYYFCCKMCIKEFEADPSKYLKKESKD
jgi:YHS domain-containing protein